MKGIVEFVVRDKYGRIKETRKEHNTITDAFKAKIEKYINEYIPFRTSQITAFPTTNASDFQGIWLHSKQITDKYDIPPIMLSGGINARTNAVDMSYSPAIVNIKDDSTKTITTSWAWIIPRSMSINSVSLHKSSFIDGSSYVGSGQQTLPLGSGKYLLTPYSTANTTGSKYEFRRLSVAGIDMTNLSTKVTSNNYIYSVNTVPTHTGMLFSYPNQSTSIPHASVDLMSDSVLYIVPNENIYNLTSTNKDSLIQNASITIQRSQFSDLPSRGACSIVTLPTKEKDFAFVAPYVAKSGTIKVYELPRSQSSDLISPIESISYEPTSDNNDGVERISVFGNFASIAVSDTAECKIFHVHRDGTHTVYDGTPMNKTIRRDGYGSNYSFWNIARQFPDDKSDGRMRFAPIGSSVVVATQFLRNDMVHNTILNLQSPISLNKDDTLTITYKIIAS